MTPEIEAECLDCGQKIAEGEVPTLDAYDTGPSVPYCPNCKGDNLQFLPLREDFPRSKRD